MCDDGHSWGEQHKAYIAVPVNSAMIISEAYNKDQVIIISWDKRYRTSHITTFGKTFTDSQQAAVGGNMFKAALKWPDKLCHAEPNRVYQVKQALKRFKAIVNAQDCLCEDGYTCTIHEDLILANEAIMAML